MILVTGATGKVGGALARRLASMNVPVRALARNLDKARDLSDLGIEVVQGNFSKPETLDAALRRVEKLFLLSPSNPRQVELEGNVVDAAKWAGVKHIVRLSVLGASPLTAINLIRWHYFAEKRVEDSGIPFTFLRPNTFMQNLLMDAKSIVSEGKLYIPGDDCPASMVDVRDIAAVAAVTLTQNGHLYRTYDITGPELLTYSDAAAHISAVIGKPVSVVNVPPEEMRGSLVRELGGEAWLADDIILYHDYFRNGWGEVVTKSVLLVTGKEPIRFERFARDYANVFMGKEAPVGV